MTDVKQLRESLRGVAREALSTQPNAEAAESVCAELTSVFFEELDRMQAAWCGPKGRWGGLPAGARQRLALREQGKAKPGKGAEQGKAKPGKGAEQGKPEDPLAGSEGTS
jgi:hypothetical protein